MAKKDSIIFDELPEVVTRTLKLWIFLGIIILSFNLAITYWGDNNTFNTYLSSFAKYFLYPSSVLSEIYVESSKYDAASAQRFLVCCVIIVVGFVFSLCHEIYLSRRRLILFSLILRECTGRKYLTVFINFLGYLFFLFFIAIVIAQYLSVINSATNKLVGDTLFNWNFVFVSWGVSFLVMFCISSVAIFVALFRAILSFKSWGKIKSGLSDFQLSEKLSKIYGAVIFVDLIFVGCFLLNRQILFFWFLLLFSIVCIFPMGNQTIKQKE